MKGTSSVPSYPQIAASLVGNWRDHHLFALRQALAVFEFYVSQLAECDTEIERAMALLLKHAGAAAAGKHRSCAGIKNQSIRERLKRPHSPMLTISSLPKRTFETSQAISIIRSICA